VDPKIAGEYKNAIEEAISIAVDKNLDKIEGVTYVFCDVSGSMQSKISGGKYKIQNYNSKGRMGVFANAWNSDFY
jgi:uncharacterized protein YdeI (BOF family)